jgi:hypothetical protein
MICGQFEFADKLSEKALCADLRPYTATSINDSYFPLPSTASAPDGAIRPSETFAAPPVDYRPRPKGGVRRQQRNAANRR